MKGPLPRITEKKSSSAGSGSDVKAGGESVNQPGRGDPNVGQGAGDVKTAPSNAPGRSDSK